MREPTRDDAWEAIVAIDREQGQRLFGYVLRLGIDPGRAADLVQEALPSLNDVTPLLSALTDRGSPGPLPHRRPAPH